MKEYCVYWLRDGEPMHEAFSCMAEAEMFSCMIRGQENVEYVEVVEEDLIDSEELDEIFPEDLVCDC